MLLGKSLRCAAGIGTTLVIVAAAQQLLAAEFQGLGDLPLGRFSSDATGLSDDGSIVVGTSYTTDDSWSGYYWTVENGMQALGAAASDVSGDGQAFLVGTHNGAWVMRFGPHGIPEVEPIELPTGTVQASVNAISRDGSVVVGALDSAIGKQAYRWTKETGIVALGDLDGGELNGNAWGVSGDGRVIVGSGSRELAKEAFRWTAEEGMVGLGTLPGMGWSVAWAASADGRVIVGDSYNPETEYEAFRWTAETRLVGLGDLPGGMDLSRAFAVSADGSVIVGVSNTDLGDEAFLWDAGHGMRNLRQVLIDDYGLGSALDGWILASAADVSADGRVIVGAGINPDGNREAWRAVLVPEPSTLRPLLIASVLLSPWIAGRGAIRSRLGQRT